MADNFFDSIPVPQQAGPRVTPLPMSPREQREIERQAAADARADKSDARQDRNEARQERTEARVSRPAPGEGLMWGPDGSSVIAIPGGVRDVNSPFYKATGRVMRGGDADKLAAQIDQYDLLKGAAQTYDPDYAGNTWTGEGENWAQSLFGTGTPGQNEWWSNFRSFDNLYRNELFGASLTDGEKQAYAQTTVSPRMDPAQVRLNVNRRTEIIRKALERRADRLRAGGYDEREVQAAAGEFAADLGLNIPIEQAAPKFAPPQDEPPAPTGENPNTAPLVGGLPEGTDIAFNFAKQDGGFDRPAWLQSNFGITPNQEAQIAAFMKANRGNPNFNYQNLAEYYKAVGAPPPLEEPGTINAIRQGNVNVTGFDSTQAENEYQQALQQRVKERDTFGGAVDTIGRTGANALLGAGDRVAAGFDTLTGPDDYSTNLARQRFESDAAREANPLAALTGDVIGLTGGTIGTGRMAQGLATRFAPGIARQGAAGSSVARNLANDTAYGTAYGATEQGNPLAGGAFAAGGSIGGQIIGKGLQKGLQGAVMSAPAQRLRDLGVNNLTIGQMMGGKAKDAEDAMTSVPWLGDIVKERRLEGIRDFNTAAFNEAGAPIGATIGEIGDNGVNQLMGRVGGAYDNATQGVRAPLDAQFQTDMQAAAMAGAKLPPDYQARFNKIGENRLGPITDAGEVTGKTYQQAMRGFKGARKSASGAAPGFEQDYKDAITLSMDALKGQMQRGGGQSVIDGLAYADQSNRLGKTLEDAVKRARNGSRSGEVQTFMPSQLNDAAYAAQAKFPGARPFSELADTAQEVLPSQLPDSGTSRRLAQMLLPTTLGGLGAGGGAALPGVDMQTGGVAGLTIGALMALGGTKAGQKALEAALFKRPAPVRRAGGFFGSGKGQQSLSGMVTAPLLIE